MRVGIGYDSHRLVEGRRLVIGGIEIPFGKGLLGHSDADVLCHAITDAVIGALGLGDLGKYFPDTDPRWKDASSIQMLREIIDITRLNGYEVTWVDSIILAEEPKMSPYIESMKMAISDAGISPGAINIKAKTNEGMDAVGRGEGIAAHAVCLLLRVCERMDE